MEKQPAALHGDFYAGFQAQIPSTDRQHAQVVDFDPLWVVNGLPVGVGAWIMENLKPGQLAIGVRHYPGGFLPFTLRRGCERRGDAWWSASFELTGGLRWAIMPGRADLEQKSPRHLIETHREYKRDDGETYWHCDMRMVRSYQTLYNDCPAVADIALKQINDMVWRLTRVPKRRPSTLLSMLLSMRDGSVSEVDNEELESTSPFMATGTPTTPPLERAYGYVASVYRLHGVGAAICDPEPVFYVLLLEEMRRTTLDEDYRPEVDFSPNSAIWYSELANRAREIHEVKGSAFDPVAFYRLMKALGNEG